MRKIIRKAMSNINCKISGKLTTVMETDLLQLLSRFQSRLPAATYDDVKDLIDHGEWGVALEDMCVQLFEFLIALLNAGGKLALPVARSAAVSA